MYPPLFLIFQKIHNFYPLCFFFRFFLKSLNSYSSQVSNRDERGEKSISLHKVSPGLAKIIHGKRHGLALAFPVKMAGLRLPTVLCDCFNILLPKGLSLHRYLQWCSYFHLLWFLTSVDPSRPHRQPHGNPPLTHPFRAVK